MPTTKRAIDPNLPAARLELVLWLAPEGIQGLCSLRLVTDLSEEEPRVETIDETDVGPFAYEDELRRCTDVFLSRAFSLLDWPRAR